MFSQNQKNVANPLNDAFNMEQQVARRFLCAAPCAEEFLLQLSPLASSQLIFISFGN